MATVLSVSGSPSATSRTNRLLRHLDLRLTAQGHEVITERITEYAALGIEEFVLSGYPHLEEAYWFGEGVLPRLATAGLWTPPHGTPTTDAARVPFAG